MRSRSIAVSLCVFLLPVLAGAATWIVPPDAELIRAAHSIAVVNIQSSQSYRADDGAIYTDYTATVEQPIKSMARAGATITIGQRGGRVGDRGMIVTGEPAYAAGERVLVFLQRTGLRRYTTLNGELGRFHFVTDVLSRTLLARGATDGEIFGWDLSGEAHVERVRDAAKFLRYIEDEVAGRASSADYFLEPARASIRANNHGVPAWDYTYLAETAVGIRIDGGARTFVSKGTQTGVTDLPSAVGSARGTWNGAGAGINLTFSPGGGVGSYPDDNDRASTIYFDTSPGGGNAGQATMFYGEVASRHTKNGATFDHIYDCDIAITPGLSGSAFEAVLAHEMGHCLGFRHSDAPFPGQTTNDSNALMHQGAVSSTSLRNWDFDATAHVYGNGGTTCTPPSIQTHPGNVTITQGNNTTLTVSATGTGPLSYQWYIGTSPNTAQPTGTNSASLQVSPSTTTSYWVRVSGACAPAANSNTATVTVNPPTCTPPSIQSSPGSVTINEGAGTTLSVTAAGTAPLSYQWYIGTAGNTSNPTGTNSSSLFVNPSTTTSYWVRVTGQCGSPADSATATVTVNAATCVPPQIVSGPASQSIFTGQLATLTVNATGSGLVYQWFIGTSGNTSNPTGSGQNVLAVSPSVTTSYWVRVSGRCGDPVNSPTAVVTVNTCPDITVNTPTATKQQNGSYVLAVSATSAGQSLTLQWFRGNTPGSGGTFVGTGASINVPAPTGPTSYWVRVSNECGKVAFSPLVTISTCELPAITTQPADQAIASGASATLTVAFTPTAGATVTWYRGTAPDKSNQAGTGTSFNTGALTAAANFFAAITNTCGEVLTRTAAITISCTKPTVNQPANVQVNKGKPATLTVVTTGTAPLTYQWYEGQLGVTLFPVGTNSATLVTAPLQSSTQYWVLVRNACGEAFTQNIQVKVVTPKRRSSRHP